MLNCFSSSTTLSSFEIEMENVELKVRLCCCQVEMENVEMFNVQCHSHHVSCINLLQIITTNHFFLHCKLGPFTVGVPKKEKRT
jgi:hypothetical protein